MDPAAIRILKLARGSLHACPLRPEPHQRGAWRMSRRYGFKRPGPFPSHSMNRLTGTSSLRLNGSSTLPKRQILIAFRGPSNAIPLFSLLRFCGLTVGTRITSLQGATSEGPGTGLSDSCRIIEPLMLWTLCSIVGYPDA